MSQERDGKPSCLGEANLYAQKLNNSAAFCIEIGQYDRAIKSLGKALKISAMALDSNSSSDETTEDATCFCINCSIEGCILYSESIPANLLAAQSQIRVASPSEGSKKRRLVPQASQYSLFKSRCPWRQAEEEEQHPQQQSAGFSIYRRPIQVSPQSISEKHNLGTTVSLLIIFNLALAHHQIALSISEEDKQLSVLKKTLKLYELAGSCYTRYKNRRNILGQEQTTADRFEMILCNNLSHVYRSSNQPTKCEACLERLTSSLMLFVDHKLATTGQQQQEPQTEEESNCENEQSLCAEEKERLDGFFQTAAQQILKRQCADAA
eukprot:CAMPEP_0116128478 /NCGR_PEP_ID=MMETSP0329-20121206/7381_1 /TAXON_ID=697910 /ORGANISM="Pseudo-nitzschia arenysensis, Strain B593" /LENGTH=322 /DNA_ID=CAMNT_0003622619 /DNA_START=769 /DNA_END=1737 /DNA_ORIENTATION=-